MANEQQITIIGFAGKDPEAKITASGKSCANISVAYTPSVKNAEGSYEPGNTVWFLCSAFGRLAENICDQIHKGDKVVCYGYLDSFTGKNGELIPQIRLIDIGKACSYVKDNSVKSPRDPWQ